MSAMAVLAASAVNGGAMRIALLIMVVVAVALILVGCGIALLTLFKQRRNQAADDTLRE
jgi:flagellar basal body-associated protein FliL